MTKLQILFIIILSIFVTFNNANATDEVSVNPIYKEAMKILKKDFPLNTFESEKWKDISVATDYAVEIIKKSPRSLEAYSIINSIGPSQKWNNDNAFKNFYLKWREKILNDPGTPDDDGAEKLIFLRVAIFAESEFTETDYIYEKNRKNYFEYLKKMKNECTNKEYAALALAALSFGKKNTYREEFLNKYSDHPAAFLVQFAMLGEKTYDNKYDEYLAELNKLMQQYKDTEMPGGWKFEYDCHSAFVWAYCAMNEKEKAQNSLSIIEKNVPNYYSLSILKKMVNRCGKSYEQTINEAIEKAKALKNK